MPGVKVEQPKYAVAGPPPPSPRARAATGTRTVAVFVAHGMGQQIPYQTLDSIAESLRKIDADSGNSQTPPVSRAFKFGEQWLQRIELLLKENDGPACVHVYEGYWAPLTEGRINGKQVIAFLAGAGLNGIRNWGGKFNRWLFDRYASFPVPARTVFMLFTALAAVAALVAMNSTIAVVAAARTLLAQRPEWLTDSLFADLTTTFNFVVTTFALFGLSLTLAHLTHGVTWSPVIWLKSLLIKVWGFASLITFVITLFAVILGGLSLALLFIVHVRGAAGSSPVWYAFVNRAYVDAFNQAFDYSAGVLVVAALIFFAAIWVVKLVVRFVDDIVAGWHRVASIVVAVVFVALVWATVRILLDFYFLMKASPAGDPVTGARHALAWPLLVLASAFVRSVLVQYLGDVAIYVTPYKLDLFNDLRKEIKDCVYKVARAVYEQRNAQGTGPLYDKIIIVGHSLGSVIAYDTLNRLILEDAAAGGGLEVVARTPLLLTFGSPLDKTAFIFSLQGHSTSEAREAVVTSMQPLIENYDNRPTRWVNIFSPWDIISGSLDFYDAPGTTDARKVDNQRDPDATTLLIAHTEYWGNALVTSRLYEEV